jgi:outer membrane protein TolC
VLQWFTAAALAGVVPAWGAGAVTLEQCVETALERGPRVSAADARASAAGAASDEAGSMSYPRLYVAGSYMVTDNPPQAFMMALNQRSLDMAAPGFNPNQPGTVDGTRWTVGAQYRVLDMSRGAAVEMAGQAAVAAGSRRDAVRNQVAHHVAERYYAALMARAFVAVREDAVRSIEESLRIANERLKAGAAVRADVLTLDVKMAEAQEALIRSRSALKLAVAALNAAVGSGDAIDAGQLQDVPEPAVVAGPATDAVAAVVRPEMRALAAAARAGAAAERRAVGDRWPVISAFGTFDMDSGNWRDYESSYFAGVTVEWDIFDGFRRSGAERRARAERIAVEQDLAEAAMNVGLDVRHAQLQVGDAWERLGVARKSMASAEEALRVTQERYQQGAADMAELAMAQSGLTAVRVSRTSAYYEYLTAVSNLQRATGVRASIGGAAKAVRR